MKASVKKSVNVEKMADFLRDNKDTYFSGYRLCKELKISSSYSSDYRDRLLEDHPDISWKKGSGYICKSETDSGNVTATEPVFNATQEDSIARDVLTNVALGGTSTAELIFGKKDDMDIKEPKSKYDENKNEEGYNDPTPYFAFKQDGKGHGGEIWKMSCSDGKKVPVLVINGTKSIAQVLYLYDAQLFGVDRCRSFKNLDKTWYYDPFRLYMKSQRFLENKLYTIDINEFNKVRGSIMDILGMPDRVIEVPVEVEKIVEKPVEVEKIVEVEKPVLPDGYSKELDELRKDIRTFEELYYGTANMASELEKKNAILDAQLDIYKKLYNDLMDRIIVTEEEPLKMPETETWDDAYGYIKELLAKKEDDSND